MSVRLALPPKVVDSLDEPRPSASIARVAKTLGVSVWHVQRLINDGKIEAYRSGVRQVRVYLDSAAAFQRGGQIAPKPEKATEGPPGRRAGPRGQTASHREAVAALRSMGLL